MLDIGWGELLLIGVVALIVVGPKDLPALFRTLGNFAGKARAMGREFQRSLEQAANEAGVSEMSKSLRSLDEGLNAATDSARRFARQPMRTAVEETVRTATAAPAAAAGATVAAPPPTSDTPAPGPADGAEQPAGR